AVDLVVLAAALLTPAVAGDEPRGQRLLWGFVVLAAVAVGLPRWPLYAALAAALGLGTVDLVVARLAGPAYPGGDAVPDSLTPAAVVVVVWLVARSTRGSAESIDRRHAHAVRRAAEVAVLRERLRQQAILGGELLSTLTDLADADADAVTDPQFREQ